MNSEKKFYKKQFYKSLYNVLLKKPHGYKNSYPNAHACISRNFITPALLWEPSKTIGAIFTFYKSCEAAITPI